VFTQVCDFLEIDSAFRPDFEIVNQNIVVRSIALRDFLLHPPRTVRNLGHTLLPGGLWQRTVKALTSLNESKRTRAPLSPVLRLRLQEEFATEVKELSDLVGRDLGHWSQNTCKRTI
jgi:hypothetical protein